MPRPKTVIQPTTKRAAVYLRVSTEDQADDGYGLDVQAERCKAQIVAKVWTYAGEYTDAGCPARKGQTNALD